MTLSSFSFLYFCLEQRPRLSNHFCICSLYLSCSVLSLLSENDDEVCIDAWAYLVGDGGFGVKSNFSKKTIYSWELRFPFTTIWLAETTDDLMPLNPAVTFQFTFSWPLSSTWPHWCLPPARTLQDATLSWTASSVFGWGFLLFAASFFFFPPYS